MAISILPTTTRYKRRTDSEKVSSVENSRTADFRRDIQASSEMAETRRRIQLRIANLSEIAAPGTGVSKSPGDSDGIGEYAILEKCATGMPLGILELPRYPTKVQVLALRKWKYTRSESGIRGDRSPSNAVHRLEFRLASTASENDSIVHRLLGTTP